MTIEGGSSRILMNIEGPYLKYIPKALSLK